jgi:hypothetical protein
MIGRSIKVQFTFYLDNTIWYEASFRQKRLEIDQANWKNPVRPFYF